MKQAIPNLELPPGMVPDRPPVKAPTDATLRWRIAKRQGMLPIPRHAPQGEPFAWVEPAARSRSPD